MAPDASIWHADSGRQFPEPVVGARAFFRDCETTMLEIIIPIFLVLIVAAIFFAVLVLPRRRAQSAQLIEQTDGSVRVPLAGAYGVPKAAPWISITRNNLLSPSLVLHDHEIEYRVIASRRRRYTDVSHVDARTGLLSTYVILAFRDSSMAFSGDTASKRLAADVLRFLAEKGCMLTDRARSLIADFPLDGGRAIDKPRESRR